VPDRFVLQAIVPVSISYDVPLEEPAMAQQLLGRPKKKETLFGFANAFFGMRLSQNIARCKYFAEYVITHIHAIEE
jgi:hypothetical protein